MMRLAAAPIALTVLLLAGCSAATPAQALPESDYFSLARGISAKFESMSDDQLRTLGKATCKYLGTVKEDAWLGAVKTMADSGYTGGEAGQLIAFSVSEYCPDQAGQLPPS